MSRLSDGQREGGGAMRGRGIYFLMVLVLGLTANAGALGPVAVSPGGEGSMAVINQECPTFSWSEVEGAVSYQVKVFEMLEGQMLSYEVMEKLSGPVLSVEIMAPAFSWTPSAGECFGTGKKYVWYVGAVGSDREERWSEGRGFEVGVGISVGVREAVRETVNEYLTKEWVLTESYQEVKDGITSQVSKEVGGGGVAATQNAMPLATEGTYNTFYGTGAGASIGTNTAASDTFIGAYAGNKNTTGYYNTFVGYGAGYSNTVGSANTFLGSYAGNSNQTGSSNTFLGTGAGSPNTTGSNNTIVGFNAGFKGSSNTILGYYAGYYIDGSNNTFLGNSAGFTNTSGNQNVFLGNRAGFYETGSNKLYIANSDTTTPLIYGEFDNQRLVVNGNLGIGTTTPQQKIDLGQGEITVNGADTTGSMPPGMFSWENGRIDFGFGGAGGGNLEAYSKGHARAGQFKFIYGGGDFGSIVYAHYNPARAEGYQWLDMMTLDKDGHLYMAGGAYTDGVYWIDASSREYKENIRELGIDEAMDTLSGLSPVTFNYKRDPKEPHVGFIAEDVPALVATKDRKGMSPMDVVAVLTKVVQEQQKTISELSERLKELEGNLRPRVVPSLDSIDLLK
jgi:hypothetical protein